MVEFRLATVLIHIAYLQGIACRPGRGGSEEEMPPEGWVISATSSDTSIRSNVSTYSGMVAAGSADSGGGGSNGVEIGVAWTSRSCV